MSVRALRRRHAIDTNVWIDAFRDPDESDALDAFVAAWSPYLVMPAVVAQELLAGCRTDVDRRRVRARAIEPFARLGRILAPSAAAWVASGDVLARLAPRDTVPTRAFANDVLLAATCREHGVVLVTRNLRDFRRIARQLAHEVVAPWPGIAAP